MAGIEGNIYLSFYWVQLQSNIERLFMNCNLIDKENVQE